MHSNKEFAEKFIFRKNFQNIEKIMELRENWNSILPEKELEAIPNQMLTYIREKNILTILCKPNTFLACSNNRDKIKNKINIYFGQLYIESIKILVQTE